MPKRGISVALAIFLGGLGVHRFYVGQVGKGIVFLLFSWTFVPSFIGLIDAIRWAMMKEKDFQEKYATQV